jgi:histone deacetylase 1/2
MATTKPVVDYYYDSEIGNFCLGLGHPMRPQRVRLTHNLCVNYGLTDHCNVMHPTLPGHNELTRFHSDDYIDFLSKVTPDNMCEYLKQLQRFNLGFDCPVFDGIYEYCQTYVAGSIGGAQRLNNKDSNIVINWAGGMHHAKKSEASGFCYLNDIVLGILELLKVHQRVLYIDIDIHHGDGVEEAFYTTNRVMTLSFHQSGDFFPGTGLMNDHGHERGRHHSINFPLHEGMNDQAYEQVYTPVVDKVMEMYRPEAIVMCCGADSLAGDRLGCWNLSIKGHGKCLEYVKKFNVPLLILGGGGYTLRNVPRCWTYETATLIGVDVADELPHSQYSHYFAPEYKLHLPVTNMDNLNSKEYLEKTQVYLMELLRDLEAAPSVQIQTGQPGTAQTPGPMIDAEEQRNAAEDEADPDLTGGGVTSSNNMGRRDPLEWDDNAMEGAAPTGTGKCQVPPDFEKAAAATGELGDFEKELTVPE